MQTHLGFPMMWAAQKYRGNWPCQKDIPESSNGSTTPKAMDLLNEKVVTMYSFTIVQSEAKGFVH
jgi:hypothetical protein